MVLSICCPSDGQDNDEGHIWNQNVRAEGGVVTKSRELTSW